MLVFVALDAVLLLKFSGMSAFGAIFWSRALFGTTFMYFWASLKSMPCLCKCVTLLCRYPDEKEHLTHLYKMAFVWAPLT